MTFVVLNCPQCAAPLPRAAYWRTVTCTYCGTTVSRGAETVRRADFRAAFDRTRASLANSSNAISISGDRYAIHHLIARGTHSEVYLARRVHMHPSWVTLKLAESSTGKDADALQREANTLDELNSLRTAGAAYFTQRIPQLVSSGVARNVNSQDRFALVLRHPVGFWGNLFDAAVAAPTVSDPRHVVWIWRRALEVLAWVHDNGWAHGKLDARHLLVHPQNHGVLIVGWAHAKKGRDPAIDLQQLAWTMRQILEGDLASQRDDEPRIPAGVPAPIAKLVQLASEDLNWCRRTGARKLHEDIGRAAIEAFGPPRFVPLVLP